MLSAIDFTQKMVALHVNIKLEVLQLKKKHINETLQYKWTVVQFVISKINGTTTITMN